MSAITYFIKRNDMNLFYFLNKRISCQILNFIMRFLTEVGSTAFSVILSILFILFRKDIHGNMAGLLILTQLGSQMIIQLLKRVVNRPRPYKTYSWVIARKPPKCKYSFPSGHTSSAFAIAFVLAYFIPWLVFIAIPVAFLVGISRVYLGCHYPTDVFMGFLISFSTFTAISQIFSSYL